MSHGRVAHMILLVRIYIFGNVIELSGTGVRVGLREYYTIIPDFFSQRDDDNHSCHQPYSQGRLPGTFMLNRYYKSIVGSLSAVAIAISDDDSDSNGEYYSLNQYSAACLVRYLLESLLSRL